ncbi:hypothetical protein AZOA_18170 [Azoarcus sp. Aa7]|nr:hypothetical protein [Azoarcus sp. Aa7]
MLEEEVVLNRTTVLLAGTLLLAGCTILRPIEPPRGDDTFFRTELRKDGPERCALGGDLPDECLIPADNLDNYAGELGHAIWEADLYRRRLAFRGAERTNLNSAYNALLWPVVAYVGVRSIADPSASLLRDAGAVALASYGLLNSGIPERDKLYIEASRRIACAIALATADLYLRADIEDLNGAPGSPRRSLPRHQDTLEQTMQQLDIAIDRYEYGRTVLLSRLETRKAPPDERMSIQRRRDEALGNSKHLSPAGGNAIEKFSAASQRKLDAAGALLAELNTAYRSLQSSGERLRLRRSNVEASLNAALNARAPTLAEPSAVAAQLATLTAKFDRAIAARGTGGQLKAEGALQTWEANRMTLAGLTPESRKAVLAFENDAAVDLVRAARAAEQWKKDIEARKTSVRESAARNGCSDALFADVGPLPLPAVPAPATPGTTGSGDVRPLEER